MKKIIQGKMCDTETATAESKYITRMTKVPGYMRRLPDGQVPSQSSKESAQKLGIELKEGETYVRPHEKTVHTLKQDFPWREHTLTAKEA